MRILILSKLDVSGVLNVNRLVRRLHGTHDLQILLSDLVLDIERSGQLTKYCTWHDRDFMVEQFFPFLDSLDTDGETNAKFLTFSAISKYYGIPVTLLHNDTRDNVLLSVVQQFKPDIVYCCRFDYILRAPFLHALSRAPINTHSGTLPDLCGPNATFWAMFMNKQHNACSLHWITPVIDGGPLLASPLHKLDYARSFFWNRNQVYKNGINAFMDILAMLENGETPPAIAQDHTRRAYYSFPTEIELSAFTHREKCLYSMYDFHNALQGFLPTATKKTAPTSVPCGSLAAWLADSLQAAGLETAEPRQHFISN